jgi:hypothetical protein
MSEFSQIFLKIKFFFAETIVLILNRFIYALLTKKFFETVKFLYFDL